MTSTSVFRDAQSAPASNPSVSRRAVPLLLLGSGLLGAALPVQAADPAADKAASEAAGLAPESSSDNAAQLGRVVVRTRKREELLQDVPLSVSAIDGDTQELQHLDKLQEFSLKIPNFQPNTSNPRTSSLSIRGAGGVLGGSDGSESGVGLIIDNVFFTHVGFAWGGLFDVQAVEVARGPQGTLLGKNTTIGAVQITTNQPSFKPENSVEIAPGNFNSLEVKAHSTGALIGDSVAYRVSYFSAKDDGRVHNPAYPRIPDDRRGDLGLLNTDRWGARGQLLFKLSDNLKSRLIVEHTESNEYNNYGGTVAPVLTHYADGSAYTTYDQKINSLFGISDPNHNPYVGSYTNPSTLTATVNGLSNELNWAVGDYTLTSVTAWRRFQLWPRNTQGYYGLYVVSTGYDVYARLLSQEFRLASSLNGVLDYQVGVYGLIDNRDSNFRYIYGRDAAAFQNNNASVNPDILDGVEYDHFGTARNNSLAPFGQATWHVTSALDLTAGLRYTHEKRKGGDRGYSFGGAQNLSTSDQALRDKTLLSTGGTFDISGQERNGTWSWLINPSYKLNEQVLVYGSVARGAKSGAVNTDTRPVYVAGVVQGSYPVITKPEVAQDYEVGIKNTLFDRRLSINLGLYWENIHDYQGTITDNTTYKNPDGTQLFVSYLGNVPQVRLRGIELETVWAPLPRLNLFFNGAITEAQYQKFDNAAAPADYGYSGGPKTLSLSGKQIAVNNTGISPWNVNLGADYSHAAGSFQNKPIEWFGYVNESGRGRTRYSNPYEQTWLGQQTYYVTNAGIGLRRSDDTLAITLYGKNVFDQEFFVSKSAGTTNAPATVGLGDPRTYGVSFRLSF